MGVPAAKIIAKHGKKAYDAAKKAHKTIQKMPTRNKVANLIAAGAWLAPLGTIAISQQNIKRMLAYSTIANIGFILLGVSVGLFDGYKASMFYTITYVITTIAAFGLVSQLICKENAIACETIISINKYE